MNKIGVSYKDEVVYINGFGIIPLEELLFMIEELFEIKLNCRIKENKWQKHN